MEESVFDNIVKNNPGAIIHITGGEPSMVPWLYGYLKENGDQYQFHLNTNAVIAPPAESVKRLKISLDSCNKEYWDDLVGVKGTFDKVVKNIKESIDKTVVSLTYTITHQNINNIKEFVEFSNKEFNGLYAVFFSVYKGTDDRFKLTDDDVNNFFSNIKPWMIENLDQESGELLKETIDEKFRLMETVRFPENDLSKTCWISLSERVYDWSGRESACSHLYRDGIYNKPGEKDKKCLYGCNRRLVQFNEEVEKRKLNIIQ